LIINRLSNGAVFFAVTTPNGLIDTIDTTALFDKTGLAALRHSCCPETNTVPALFFLAQGS
jgi:hypothetical protein